MLNFARPSICPTLSSWAPWNVLDVLRAKWKSELPCLENWSLGSSPFPSGLGISLTLFCFSGTCALKKRDGARTLRFSGVWGVGSPVPILSFQHWSTEQKKKNKKPKDQIGRPTALRLPVCPSVYPTTRLCVVSVRPLGILRPQLPSPSCLHPTRLGRVSCLVPHGVREPSPPCCGVLGSSFQPSNQVRPEWPRF